MFLITWENIGQWFGTAEQVKSHRIGMVSRGVPFLDIRVFQLNSRNEMVSVSI